MPETRGERNASDWAVMSTSDEGMPKDRQSLFLSLSLCVCVLERERERSTERESV